MFISLIIFRISKPLPKLFSKVPVHRSISSNVIWKLAILNFTDESTLLNPL